MSGGSENPLARVSRNTAILTAAQIGEKLVNFFLVVLLVRYLPQETFGQYSFVTSFVLLFNVLIGLGFTPLCIREISRSPGVANKMLSAAAVPMAFTSVLTLGLVGTTVAWSKGDAALVVPALLATFELVLSSYTQLFAAVARAHERMEFSVVPQLMRSLLVFLACLILIPRGLGLPGIFVVIAVAGSVRLLLQVLVVRSVFGIALERFDAQLSKQLLRQAYPLAVASIFVIIYYKIDAVMISYMLDDARVGLYTAATTMAFAPFFVAQAFHQATFPSLTKLADQPGEHLTRAYNLSIKYLALAGLPITCGLAVLAPRFILLVYDDRYLDAAGPLRVLAGALCLMFLNGFIGNTLIAMNRQKVLMHVVAGAAAVNVALNFVAIPRFGLLGAASATVLSEVIAAATSGYAVWRGRGLSIPVADLMKLLIATAAMGAFVVWAQSMSLLLLVPSSAAVYAALVVGSGAVDRDELRRVGAMIGRRTAS